MMPLKIQVERVVRPIRASGRRKDRMREELLAHLTATCHEELAKDGDEPAAVERALQRFGNPDDLRRELQASVTLPERLLYVRIPYGERYAAIARRAGKWRPEESPFRYACRVTVATAILWVVAGLFYTAFCLAFLFLRRYPAVWVFVSWVSQLYGAGIGALLVAWFFAALCLDGFRRAIRPRPFRFQNTLRGVGWCALAIPITCVVAVLFRILAPRWLPPDKLGYPMPDIDFAKCFLPLFWAAIVASPFWLAWVGVSGLADQKRYEEWESLPLDR